MMKIIENFTTIFIEDFLFKLFNLKNKVIYSLIFLTEIVGI